MMPKIEFFFPQLNRTVAAGLSRASREGYWEIGIKTKGLRE